MITWDETKRQRNLHQHGIDLANVESIFDKLTVTQEDDRAEYGEQRLRTLGEIEGRIVCMIWTDHPEGAHIISCRYATNFEIRAYLRTLNR